MQNWTYEGQVGPNLQRQSYVRTGYNTGYERLFASEFGVETFSGLRPEVSATSKNFFAYAGSSPTKRITLNYFFGYRWGQLDYDFGTGRRYPRVSAAAVAARAATAAGRCESAEKSFIAPSECSGAFDPGTGDFLYTNGGITYKASNALNMSLTWSRNRLTRDDTGLVAFNSNIWSARTDLPVHALRLRARAPRLQLDHVELPRAVPLRLDAEPGHGLLRRLQRRRQPRLLQPVLGPARPGLPPQQPQLLHQSLLPLPPQLLKA